MNLTDKQLAEIKGGPGSTWCSQCLVIYSNHNETTVSDESEAEDDFLQFADLDLTDEQLAEIKGGPGWCIQCGGIYSNHNETTVSDESEAEDDFLQFADLNLTDEQLAEIKGGPGGGFSCTWCGVNGGNHNETMEEEEEHPNAFDSSLADLEPNTQIQGGVTKRIWDYIRSNN